MVYLCVRWDVAGTGCICWRRYRALCYGTIRVMHLYNAPSSSSQSLRKMFKKRYYTFSRCWADALVFIVPLCKLGKSIFSHKVWLLFSPCISSWCLCSIPCFHFRVFIISFCSGLVWFDKNTLALCCFETPLGLQRICPNLSLTLP